MGVDSPRLGGLLTQDLSGGTNTACDHRVFQKISSEVQILGLLVGGFNPFEKYAREIGSSSPQGSG